MHENSVILKPHSVVLLTLFRLKLVDLTKNPKNLFFFVGRFGDVTIGPASGRYRAIFHVGIYIIPKNISQE